MGAVEVDEGHEAALLALDGELCHRRRRAAVGRERLLGRAVAHEVERPEDAESADLADDRVALLQLTQARAEYVVADALGVVDDALLRHRIDGSDDGRGGERVTGIGEPAGEDTLVEGGGDRVGDDHAAHGDVAGVGALGEDDEIGLSRPVLPGKPLAGAPEAAHDLVGNPHDLVLVAQCA